MRPRQVCQVLPGGPETGATPLDDDDGDDDDDDDDECHGTCFSDAHSG